MDGHSVGPRCWQLRRGPGPVLQPQPVGGQAGEAGEVVHPGCAASRVQRPTPSSVQCPTLAASPAEELVDFMLVFMTAWCTQVSQGIKSHGPWLAHARQSTSSSMLSYPFCTIGRTMSCGMRRSEELMLLAKLVAWFGRNTIRGLSVWSQPRKVAWSRTLRVLARKSSRTGKSGNGRPQVHSSLRCPRQ